MFTSAAYDTAPRAGDSPPAHPYVICSTPRSGSNLLCTGLCGTRLVGAPFEHFNPTHRPVLERRWGCDGSLESFVRALYRHRTTADGYFGTKMHWDNFVSLRGEALGVGVTEPDFGTPHPWFDSMLPGARFVRMVRQDLNRQAVSFWIAWLTGVWSDRGASVPRGEPWYSFEGIDRCRRAIENSETHWDRYLRARGAEPYVVVYETLVADYAATVRDVIGFLAPGVDAGEVPSADLIRQSGPLTEEMLERFADERGRRGLPGPHEVTPQV